METFKKLFTKEKNLYLISAIGTFVITWAVNLAFFLDNPGFVGIQLHPYLLIVVLTASLYGYTRAMVTTAGVSLIYTGCIFLRIFTQGEDLTRIFQFSYFSPFISFLVLGTLVGMLTDRHKKNLLSMNTKLEENAVHIDNLHTELNILQERNSVLKQKAMTNREVLSMLYNIVNRMSTLDLNELHTAILETCEELLGAGKSAVYMRQGDRLVLCTSRGYKSDEVPAPHQRILKHTIEEKKVFSVQDFHENGKRIPNPVFISAPLFIGKDGDSAGVIWIESIPFLQYSPVTLRIAGLIADWASLCLGNIFAFEALKNRTEGKNQKLYFDKVHNALANNFDGVFAYGTPFTDIEKEIRKKISLQ
ncbi:MAG: hypothetical protein JW904_01130 [Spirochaetales bacterium]|nr:hypothetical protein [Spirochaetales bacterium]